MRDRKGNKLPQQNIEIPLWHAEMKSESPAEYVKSSKY